MAQYEDAASSKQALTDLLSSGTLSQSTQSAIQALLDTSITSLALFNENASGTFTENAVVTENDITLNNVTFTKATDAVFADGTSGSATFNSDKPVEATLVNNDNLTVAVKNDADNNIDIDGGNDVSVSTGAGEDTFNVSDGFKGKLMSGGGDDVLVFDQTAQQIAEVSVDAGDGFDVMRMFGNAIHHEFSFVGGKFHMSSAGFTIEGVEVVATDINKDGEITAGKDEITVLAKNEHDSLAAKLYMVAFGREAIDNGDDPYDQGNTLAGIKFWMNNGSDNLDELGRQFLNCDEFRSTFEIKEDQDYVNTLFDNLGSSNDSLKAELLSKLESGQLDRYEVAIALAESDEAVKLLGNDGQQYVIDSDEVDFDA